LYAGREKKGGFGENKGTARRESLTKERFIEEAEIEPVEIYLKRTRLEKNSHEKKTKRAGGEYLL